MPTPTPTENKTKKEMGHRTWSSQVEETTWGVTVGSCGLCQPLGASVAIVSTRVTASSWQPILVLYQLVSTGYVRVGPLRPKVTSSRPPITVDDLSRYHRCKPVITFHFSSLRLPWHHHALPIQNTASIIFFNPSVESNQTKIDQANQTKCSNYIRIASVQLTKMESTHRHHHKHGNATDDNQNTSS